MNFNDPELISFLSSLTWQGIIALFGWTLGTIGLTYKVIKHFQPVVHTDKAECEIFRNYINTKGWAIYDKLLLTRHNKKAVHINCPLFEGKDRCSHGGKCKYF